jgi:hypothetical protein
MYDFTRVEGVHHRRIVYLSPRLAQGCLQDGGVVVCNPSYLKGHGLCRFWCGHWWVRAEVVVYIIRLRPSDLVVRNEGAGGGGSFEEGAGRSSEV